MGPCTEREVLRPDLNILVLLIPSIYSQLSGRVGRGLSGGERRGNFGAPAGCDDRWPRFLADMMRRREDLALQDRQGLRAANAPSNTDYLRAEHQGHWNRAKGQNWSAAESAGKTPPYLPRSHLTSPPYALPFVSD